MAMIDGYQDRQLRVRRSWGGFPTGALVQITDKRRREHLLRMGFLEVVKRKPGRPRKSDA